MSTNQKTGFKDLPVIVRVGIYLGGNYFLIFLSQFIVGFLPIKGPGPMNILLCSLLVLFTGVILKLENMSFRDIGCVAGNGRDLRHLAWGTVAGIMMLVATALCIQMVVGFHWQINQNFHWPHLVTAFITVLGSVFAQELSFRGYPFRLLLDKWGEWPAQVVIAILFGLMHLDGNMSPWNMLLTIMTTGMGSILFGMMVIRTRRLHMAIGLHFGWNYAQLLLPRSIAQNGEGAWLVTGGSYRPELATLIWIAPYMIIMTVAYFLVRNLRQTGEKALLTQP